MKSEWWNAFFEDSFERFRVSISGITFVLICIRLIISLTSPQDLIFTSLNIEQLLILLLISVCLKIIKHSSITTKKVFMYLAIDLINLLLRYMPKHNKPQDSMILFFKSTIITMFFQTSIFRANWTNALIIIKHIAIWNLHEGSFQVTKENATSLEVFVFIMVCLIAFEEQKRDWVSKLFKSKLNEHEAVHQFSEILRVFPDGLLIFNKRLEAKFINETSFKIFGTSKKDLLFDFSHVKAQNTDDFILDLLKEQVCEKNSVIKLLAITDINDVLYQWTITKVRWEQEDCCLAILRDVTGIITLERVSAENKGKAAVMKSVSHELRTPVNGIILIVDNLMTKVPEKYHKKLSCIKICANLLKFQISDIMDYSGLISGQFIINNTKCNLKKYLIECVDLIKVQAKYKGLNILCKIDQLIPEICIVDGYRVQKVVMNLLSNAIKYTNKGKIELCAVHTSFGICISVKDTGIGIPEARLGQIFDMLNNISNNNLCGLGLFITKAILKKMGSTIKVKSQTGQGSVFSFELNIFSSFPYEAESIDVPDETSSFIEIPNLKYRVSEPNPQVLIVDDNDFNRMCIASILKAKKIPFIEAVNGEDAIKAVLKYDKIDSFLKCVIMDCDMPVLDGWEATRRIKNKFAQGIIKHFPAIIGYTAYSAPEDIQKCYDCGMISYLLKPTDQNSFLSLISNYI